MKQLIIIAAIIVTFSLSIVCNPGKPERKSTWTADNVDTTNIYTLDQRDSVVYSSKWVYYDTIQGTDTVGLEWEPIDSSKGWIVPNGYAEAIDIRVPTMKLTISNGGNALVMEENGEIYFNGALISSDTSLVNCLYKLCMK